MELVEAVILRRYSDFSNNFKSQPKRIMRSDLHLVHAERSDVLFKTISREIRKVYLKKFAKESKYLRVQRYRDSTYYLTSLISFVKNMFATGQIKIGSDLNKLNAYEGIKSGEPYRSMEDLECEMIFLLGALFYPKRMQNIFPNKLLSSIVDIINACLY